MRHFVEEYLERNGVLRQQLRACIDINSTEGIISAVEAGLGIGFAPLLALEKPLKLGSVKAIQLDNGPIRRELSVALPNGPDPRGPAGQLLEIFREYGAAKRHAPANVPMNKEPQTVMVMGKVHTVEHEGARR